MAWLVGIDSYHPVEFNNIKLFLNICVDNRRGFEDKLQLIQDIEKGMSSFNLGHFK